MALFPRQLGFDFLGPCRAFSAQLPKDHKILGGSMYGRSPALWVLADWDHEVSKFWFLYVVANTAIEAAHPVTGLPLTLETLTPVAQIEEVNNLVYPPVRWWSVFRIEIEPERNLNET